MLNALVAESLCSITSIVASNYPAQFIGASIDDGEGPVNNILSCLLNPNTGVRENCIKNIQKVFKNATDKDEKSTSNYPTPLKLLKVCLSLFYSNLCICCSCLYTYMYV
jgi:hypothetical protein